MIAKTNLTTLGMILLAASFAVTTAHASRHENTIDTGGENYSEFRAIHPVLKDTHQGCRGCCGQGGSHSLQGQHQHQGMPE